MFGGLFGGKVVSRHFKGDGAIVADHFKRDFLDNLEFSSKFSSEIRPFVYDEIASIYRRCTENDKDISYIFLGLKDIFTTLWIEENKYGNPLALKYQQLVFKDEYGDYEFDAFYREVLKFIEKREGELTYFLNSKIPVKYWNFAKQFRKEGGYVFNQICSESPDFNIEDVINEFRDNVIFFIEPYIDALENKTIESDLDEISDPYEYERAISNELSSLGWASHTTSGSGDQGADVIAEKNGIKLIIQCKLYSSSVGNKAVQEVAAAIGYYHGDIAAVVTNQDFTESAMQLADSLEVLLVHHSKLSELDEVLFEGHE